MPEREPVSAQNCTAQYEDHELVPADPGAVIPWAEARDRVAASQAYWVATIGPGTRPHVRPVLAVWVDGLLYSTSNPGTRKARNLAGNPSCAVTATTDGIDLVVEGTAAWVTDTPTLERVAVAYHDKYGWPVTVEAGAFSAPYGAPSAGPPPYHPYAVTPTTAFALGTNEEFAPRSTRYRFA